MSSKTRIDKELPQLLSDLKLGSKKDILLFDVEASVGKGVIFDFAHGVVDLENLNTSNLEGYLVYEALRHQGIMNEISKWDKIKEASYHETYGFYQKLLNEGWYSVVISEKEIENDMNNYIRTQARQKYEKQLRYTEEQIRVEKWWDPSSGRRPYAWSASAYTRDKREKALRRVNNSQKAEKILSDYLRTEENLEKLMESKILGEKVTLSSIQEKIYFTLYNEQKQEITPVQKDADFQLIKTLNLGQPVEEWESVMRRFLSRAKSDEILAVSSYNLGGDKNFITRTNLEFGTKNYLNAFKDLQQICLMNMYHRLQEVPGEAFYDMLKHDNSQAIKRGYEEALKTKTNKGKPVSFEIAYQNEFDAASFSTKHTAMGDVEDEAKLLQEILAPYLQSIFKGR